MTEITLIHAPAVTTPGAILSRLADILALWRRRSRERQLLAQMSARERADLGVAATEVEVEVAKPFWRQ